MQNKNLPQKSVPTQPKAGVIFPNVLPKSGTACPPLCGSGLQRGDADDRQRGVVRVAEGVVEQGPAGVEPEKAGGDWRARVASTERGVFFLFF